MNLKESATQYEPPKRHTIDELGNIGIELDLDVGSGVDKEGKAFDYDFTLVDGVEYRVPGSVLMQLKTILEKKPDMKEFSVSKTGEGLSTRYTVIPL